MKREKLLFFVIGLILFSSLISAADSCNIVKENQCSSGNYKLLGLYSQTNTHGYDIYSSSSSQSGMLGNFLRSVGNAIKLFSFSNKENSVSGSSYGQIPSSSEKYVLCCNFNPGAKTCTETDEFLSLYSSSNAHAEIPQLNSYSTKICWKNLQCTGFDENAQSNNQNYLTGDSILTDYPIKMLSLSSNTNAHLAKYDYNDYDWKIVCRKITSSSSSIFGSSTTSSFVNTGVINLNPSQLGTPAAKIQIAVNSLNTQEGTQVSLEIYERDTSYYSGSSAGSQSGTTGGAIFNFKPSTNTGSSGGGNSNYIYSPIRTGTGAIVGSVGTGGNVVIDWIITQGDINKALSGDSDNSFEFTYKIIVKEESKSYYDNILNVNIASPPNPPSIIQKWLDGDRITQITSKSVNWNSLIQPNSGAGITADVVAGNSPPQNSPQYPSNLVYMDVSDLPDVAVGKKVYFEVYESDVNEDISNDSIRTGTSSLSAVVDNNRRAIASWYILQNDIEKAISGDTINPQGVGNFEFYYKAKYWNGASYVYLPVKNFLNLQVNGYPINITPAGYLYDARGYWTDDDFTEQIFSYNYTNGSTNVVGLFVQNISTPAYGQTLYFEIYGVNGTYDTRVPIVVDGSLNAVIDNQGRAYTTWTILPGQLFVQASSSTNYKFFYDVRVLQEQKSFNSNILDVNVITNNGGGGGGGGSGNECSGIYYCSDYETKSSCESNSCEDVLENEDVSNPSLSCSTSNCYCYWRNGNCYFGYNLNFVDLGNCEYTKGEVQDNCATGGVLITPYSAVWTWASGNCYSTQNSCSGNLSLGQSCVNAEGCWRIKDSSYDNCKDYQESVECSPAGSNLGNFLNNDELKGLWIYLIIGIVILGILIFFIAKRIIKEKTIKKLFKTKENYNNILSYISKARQQNVLDAEIRKNLFGAGWNSSQIEFAFKHAHRVKIKK